MTNDDRVSEVYHGRTASKTAQRVCRERIHWVIAQLTGTRVLDVGCSQGIASILAARAGYEVLGIDRESPQIEYAKAAAQEEPPAVRAKIRFELADIYETDLSGELFDTVIIAEILEHQPEPRRFFERVSRFLVPGGRIVMTTPFGLNVHDDHKQTFYLSEFATCVAGVCAPESLDVVDDYIRFTARSLAGDGSGVAMLNTPASNLLTDAALLLQASEQAFLSKEWRSYTTGKERLAKLKSRTRKLRRIELRASEQEAALARLRQQLQEMSHAMQVERRKHKQQLKEAKVPLPIRSVKKAAALLRQKTDKEYTEALKKKLRIKAAKISHHPRWPLRRLEDFSLLFDPYVPEAVEHRGQLKIATIFDTFSQHCFQYEAELLPITRAGWQAEIEAFKPAFLLAESAWRGNAGQWNYLMSNYAKREENPLFDLLTWCRANGLPSVFWNKEDPANFDVFIAVAKDFDYVFTTDGACIDRYREILGHSRVFALPFAAQPVIHNPMQRPRQRNVCFAGSWRAEKYPERGHDSEILLKPAMDYGLEIFDRFAGTKDEEKFRFPAEYAKAVRGSLDYDRMLTAYRAYKVFLNVNSVKDSPTMFSRRVFELLACGTPVVSSESAGIRALLGDHVKVVDTESDARRELGRLLDDDEYRGRFAHTGYREVMTHHTYRRRLAQVTERAGITVAEERAPLISVLAASNRPDRLQNILDNYRAQVYPELELILLLNSDRYDRAAVQQEVKQMPNVQVYQLRETLTLADCLNYGIDRSSGSYVAKFDDDDMYGAHYLSDLMLCTQFTDAPVLGKRCYYVRLDGSDQSALRFEGHEHRYSDFVHGATLLIRRTLFDRIRFTPVAQGTDTLFQRACRQYGEKIYSADRYNFVHVRHADKSKHTWKIDDEELLAKCTRVKPGLPLDEMMF